MKISCKEIEQAHSERVLCVGRTEGSSVDVNLLAPKRRDGAAVTRNTFCLL
jgi:hypothetical protein